MILDYLVHLVRFMRPPRVAEGRALFFFFHILNVNGPCMPYFQPNDTTILVSSCPLTIGANWTTHTTSTACLVLVRARTPRLPVAGAHVTPPEGGRRLAVTVTS
jgi:hypothetical protein